MREPASKRFVRLTLRAAAALALFAAPGHFTSNSLAKLLVATAYADNGGGNGNGGGGKAASRVNAATGDIIEIDGNRITIIHRNGMKEEIENGRFEMSDAQGRTIVERRATEKDLARLLGL
ncbi:MAG: hypothetical protein E5X01_05580 [Mesorhizobium sp.]|nr:MAG: hypothetical protein E5X01_05580 [Mesorhizobium sp.]